MNKKFYDFLSGLLGAIYGLLFPARAVLPLWLASLPTLRLPAALMLPASQAALPL